MTPIELKQRIGALNREQDQELDKFEQDTRSKYRGLRRKLFSEAGEQVAANAELEDEYYEHFPPASDLPPGAPLVEYL